MPVLTVSNRIQGDHGELIFEHYSEKNNYAYISLEEIYSTLTPKNILTFRKGYSRIAIKLPLDIVAEVQDICRPSNGEDLKPSFVYDYLTVALTTDYDKSSHRGEPLSHLKKEAFHWVEVKTGNSQFTANQNHTKSKIKLPLELCRIRSELPKEIHIEWSTAQPRR